MPAVRLTIAILDLLVLVGVWGAVGMLWRKCPGSHWFMWMKRIALVVTALCVILGPIFTKSRRERHSIRMTCFSNLKQHGLALNLYSADNNDFFPTPATWETASNPYRNSKLTCVLKGIKTGYAFNANVSSPISSSSDEGMILVGESAKNDNNMLIRDDSDIVARHKYPIFGFVDGHVSSPGSTKKVFLNAKDTVPNKVLRPPLTQAEK
ncbi:MAG: hypothetical protein K8R88_13790, partial [Armatimonadetes bacterium]|nr:hypothetical protein [Armatimonadota bacterium]